MSAVVVAMLARRVGRVNRKGVAGGEGVGWIVLWRNDYGQEGRLREDASPRGMSFRLEEMQPVNEFPPR